MALSFTYIDQHRVHRHARCLNRMSEAALPPPQRRGMFRAVTNWLSAPVTGRKIRLEDNQFVRDEINAYHRKCRQVMALVLAVGIAAVTCLILAGMS